MPTNHLSSNLPERLLWTQQPIMDQTPSSHNFVWSNPQFHQYPPTATVTFYRQNQEDYGERLEDPSKDEQELKRHQLEEEAEIPKEPMFEKPLTPSDVGKLNRLVIPKQQAEKYFPLDGGSFDSLEKAFVLCFEDESGKPWRFKYSYWNSSQSYVLTKGWSRFVKEKQLDAGDFVSFERHRVEGDRLFIGWRRRTANIPVFHQPGVLATNVSRGGGGRWTSMLYTAGQYPYPWQPNWPSVRHQPDYLHAAVPNQATPNGNSKRWFRLFGVNLEFQPEETYIPTTDSQYYPPTSSS